MQQHRAAPGGAEASEDEEEKMFHDRDLCSHDTLMGAGSGLIEALAYPFLTGAVEAKPARRRAGARSDTVALAAGPVTPTSFTQGCANSPLGRTATAMLRRRAILI